MRPSRNPFELRSPEITEEARRFESFCSDFKRYFCDKWLFWLDQHTDDSRHENISRKIDIYISGLLDEIWSNDLNSTQARWTLLEMYLGLFVTVDLRLTNYGREQIEAGLSIFLQKHLAISHADTNLELWRLVHQAVSLLSESFEQRSNRLSRCVNQIGKKLCELYPENERPNESIQNFLEKLE